MRHSVGYSEFPKKEAAKLEKHIRSEAKAKCGALKGIQARHRRAGRRRRA